MKNIFLFLVVFCPFFGKLTAQDTTQVRILNAKVGEFISRNNELVRKLSGNVRLQQKDAVLYCDTAILDNQNNVYAKGNVAIRQADTTNIFADSVTYRGGLRTADLFGKEVVLVSGKNKLFASNLLNYDLNTKIATFQTRSKLVKDSSQILSNRGQYFVGTDDAFFKGNVIVTDPKFSLKTDTLRFNTKTNVATFLAPTIIADDSSRIYTEAGFYDLQQDIAEFTRSPQFLKGSQKATADTMRYDGTTKFIILQGNAVSEDSTRRATANTILYNRQTEDLFLEGNARYKDQTQNVVADTLSYNQKNKTYRTRGRSRISNPPQIIEADRIDYSGDSLALGFAKGNVFYQDTSAKTTLRCDSAEYRKVDNYIRGYGNRPLLTTLVNEDTLWLRADTIISKKALPDNPKDTNKLLLAYNKVKIYKKDFQALCDSLSYSEQDSIFRLFKNPIVWSDTSQFSADTVQIALREKKIDKILLKNQGFIINSGDELYFNQIKGRDVTAFFENQDIRRMQVVGNAESVYYLLDDKKAYIGVNKSISSEMMIYFGDNKVNTIDFFAEPKSKLEPMRQANHEALKMKGFNWQKIGRPKNVNDL